MYKITGRILTFDEPLNYGCCEIPDSCVIDIPERVPIIGSNNYCECVMYGHAAVKRTENRWKDHKGGLIFDGILFDNDNVPDPDIIRDMYPGCGGFYRNVRYTPHDGVMIPYYMELDRILLVGMPVNRNFKYKITEVNL